MISKAKRYNSGKLRMELLPSGPLKEIVKVFTLGAHKYTVYEKDDGERVLGKDIPYEEAGKYKIIEDGADNWRLGQDWKSSLGSIKRHITAFENGEDIDELGTYHIANAAWGLIALLEFYKTHPELDNRDHKYLKVKRIGLDVDEVICDFVGGIMERFPEEIKLRPVYWNDPDLQFLFSRVKGDEGFWMDLKPKVNPLELPFEPDCYITSRPIPSHITSAWLDVNRFPSAPVFTTSTGLDKVHYAKSRELDWFVDDSFPNFVQMNNAGICCFLMDAPHNRRYNVGHKRIKDLKDLI